MAIPPTYLRRLVGLFLLTKALFLLVACISGLYIFPYVNNTDLLLLDASGTADAFARKLLAPFARWDGVYFLKIAADGYQFEHQHAFFPLFPLTIRAFAEALRPLVCFSLLTRCMMAGIIMANLSHFLTVLNIFRLTAMLSGGEGSFAYVSAVFALVGPAFPFQSAIYAESLFGLLASTGLLAYYNQQVLLAALCWCLSSLTRSNGMLLAGFFVHDILCSLIQRKGQFISILRNLLGAVISVAGFISFQVYGYFTYCESVQPAKRRPWCAHRIPDLYSFVQQHYWNVRPWKYYTLGQIPNFLIAAPTATICIAICIYYIRIDLRRFLTLGLSKGGQPRAGQYSSFIVKDLLVPHFILMLFMLVYTSVLVHVQIIARLFSFQPLLYWALAHFYLRGSLRTRKMLACYVLGYASIGSILFVNFYPPA